MADTETRLRTYRALSQNPDWSETLRDALEVEEKKAQWYAEKGYGEFIGWEWHDVHKQLPTLYRMVAEKLLDITLKTRSSTHFRIRSPDIVREALRAVESLEVKPEPSMPQDLFASIVGHDNIKQILHWAIEAKERVGVLLQGPPASAKTQFLMELARLPGSLYCLAQTMSAAGLAHALRVYEPAFVIIDELDRLEPADVGVMNSLLATGWVVELKMGKAPPVQLNTKVFAAGIHIHRLPQDLLSRFIRLRFPTYTQAQFEEICVTILPKEGCDPDTATLIAREVWSLRGEAADIRECVGIARLAQGEPERAEEILRTLRRQGT